MPCNQCPRRYVRHDGSDEHDGLTEATAWRTVEYAVQHAPPEAELVFGEGVWRIEGRTFNAIGQRRLHAQHAASL